MTIDLSALIPYLSPFITVAIYHFVQKGKDRDNLKAIQEHLSSVESKIDVSIQSVRLETEKTYVSKTELETGLKREFLSRFDKLDGKVDSLIARPNTAAPVSITTPPAQDIQGVLQRLEERLARSDRQSPPTA